MMKVILVHGIFDTGKSMRRLAGALEEEGHQCWCPNLAPNDGSVGLEVLAKLLAVLVSEVVEEGELFVLVGFSMGALVSRIYLQELGGAERVRDFFSISGPHSGSLMAWFGRGNGARELRPGSELLRRLEGGVARLKEVEVVCYWTPFDLMVFPARSALFGEVGERVLVWALAHPLMLKSGRLRRDLVVRIGVVEG
jgi:triacylglycerol lipase